MSALVRAIPDFPEQAVFRDITPVLADGARPSRPSPSRSRRLSGAADVVVGVEARGFLLGAACGADGAGTGIVPVRKAGKLPASPRRAAYDLEYGTATLELPADAVEAGARVFVIDDVLATGGTAVAACDLVIAAGAEVVGVQRR